MEIDEVGKMLGLTDEQIGVYKSIRRLKCVRLSDETADEMALKVGRKILDESGIDPSEIDAVVFFHSLYNQSLAPMSSVGKIQHELGLTRATGFAITGQGCASVNSAIRVSRNMILAGSAETVLVIGADALQDSKSRELYSISIVGDGASAIIMRKGGERNRLIEIGSFDEGYFHSISDWDSVDRENFDLVYMVASIRLVHRTLRRANVSFDQIKALIPHNVNHSSWDRILTFLNFPPDKFFGDNIRLNGHAYGTDIIVNLADAIRAKRIQPGDYAMIMSAGMGTLGCIIMQH
jgi:3-oxoacyl-[acyl-carrier-protein] synthase III